MSLSRFMPCPDCGASVDQQKGGPHICEPERLLDYQLFQLRDEVADFDRQLTCYLASPRGSFEQWYALRDRRGRFEG